MVQGKVCDFCKDIRHYTVRLRVSRYHGGAEIIKADVCEACLKKLLKYCRKKAI